MRSIFFTGIVLITTISVSAENLYKVDKSHSSAEFAVKHLMVSTVTGRFTQIDGKVTLNDKKNKIIAIEGEALAKSIDTNQSKRDKHLRSQDFFYASKYPKLTLIMNNVNVATGRTGTVSGYLTIRGVKKAVQFSVTFHGVITDPWGQEKAVVDATTTINREQFGLNWNETLETGGVMVGEDVKITIRSQANLTEK